jgi:hypothetical protein
MTERQFNFLLVLAVCIVGVIVIMGIWMYLQ